SRRQLDFKYREQGTSVLRNVNRLAQTSQDTAPHNDTLDDYLAGVGAAPIADLRASMMGRLIRMRALDEARVQGRLGLAVGASGYFVSRKQHCGPCLTRRAGEDVLYCHQFLEARVLGPAQMALSLQSEFIDTQDQAALPACAGEQK